MKRNSKTILTVALVVLPLLVAGVVLLINHAPSGLVNSSSVDLGKVWQDVYDAYQQDDHQVAESRLIPYWENFPSLENGCELMVSVFAEAKNIEFLELASKKCIQMQKGGDTVIEGLAYSLSFQGKIDEGIKQLELVTESHSTPRLLIALSRLHLMLGHDDDARRLYLKAVNDAEVWSMWVSYALKVPIFVDNLEFLEEMITIVINKPNVHERVETQLLAKADRLKDKLIYSQLAKRVAHKSMHSS